MKRIIAAVLLLACAIGSSVWAEHAFKVRMEGLLTTLDTIIQCAETDTESELMLKTENLLLQWQKSSGVLHSLVMHDGMDDFEENITSLPLVLRYSDREEYKNKCIEAVNKIENLLNSEKLNFENIF